MELVGVFYQLLLFDFLATLSCEPFSFYLVHGGLTSGSVEHCGLPHLGNVESVVVLAERLDPERHLGGLRELKGKHQRSPGRSTVETVDVVVATRLKILHDSENAGVIPVSLATRVERTGESVAVPEVQRAKGVHESSLRVPGRHFQPLLREEHRVVGELHRLHLRSLVVGRVSVRYGVVAVSTEEHQVIRPVGRRVVVHNRRKRLGTNSRVHSLEILSRLVDAQFRILSYL